MSKLDRHTVLIDEEVAAALRPLASRQTSEKHTSQRKQQKNENQNSRSQLPDASRIPVRGADAHDSSPTLVPVLAGPPWKHYTKRYLVKHWCLFAIASSKSSSDKLHMIRSAPSLNDENLQIIRQLCHPNILESIEIYFEEDGNHFVVSNMMETSLLHVCRAPDYPSESQLSSMLFQVLSGAEYLITQGLVPDELSCAGVLIDMTGSVRIANFDEFQQGGNVKTFLSALCRLSMMLMDKERGPKAKIGLSHLDRWSPEAVDMLSLLNAEPTMVELSRHKFWKKGKKEELKALVYFTLITAYHSRS